MQAGKKYRFLRIFSTFLSISSKPYLKVALTMGLILKCREELLELKVHGGLSQTFPEFSFIHLLHPSISFVHFLIFGIQNLQGIGEKMAEYIIGLREESPLKSVS